MKRKIIFARLGSFSHTNESLYNQLKLRFPEHEIIDFCVKEAIRKKPKALVLGLAWEIINYGPLSVLKKSTRHECFFKLPYTFKKTSELVREAFEPIASEIDAVVQTQGLFNAKILGVPLILYLDYSLKSPRFGPSKSPAQLIKLEEELYRDADAIAGASTHLKKTLLEMYGCRDDKVSVVYIGSNVPEATFDKSLARYEKQQICFVGVEWERKGGTVLEKAFARIADIFPNATLVIAGCNPPIQHPRVKVLGKVSRNDLANLYQESSIFCMPSLVEPAGIAPIEAASFGLPVVATATGGLLDSVENGVTGLLVAPGNVDELTSALYRLLKNPAQAMEMGLAGALFVPQKFNWDKIGVKLADIIRANQYH